MCKSPKILALSACLLLASCFDSREEIWIEPGGSGRAELTLTLPTAGLLLAGGRDGIEARVRRFFDQTSELELDSLEFEAVDRRTRIRLRASARSMLDLVDLQESEAFATLPPSATSAIGNFAVKLDGLDVDYRRSIDLAGSLGLAALAIPAADRENRRLEYIAHLPTRPQQHNAGQVSADGRTLTWSYSLGEALAGPLDQQARIPLPIPWGRILLVTLAVALLATVLGRRLRLRATKKPAEPASPSH